MAELGFPIVATSGNLSDEPICIHEREALRRLGGMADLFLVHNRPIVRHVDDSIARVILGREQVLRRARGMRRSPLAETRRVGRKGRGTGCGAGRGRTLEEHGGARSRTAGFSEPAHWRPRNRAILRGVSARHPRFRTALRRATGIIAFDAHPDYFSTRFAQGRLAQRSTARGVPVQHHLAHVFACLAENELDSPALGVSWDGTGYGLDGTVWGGEFFVVTPTSSRRVARFRQFRLPGGDQAVKEPRRIALGLLYEVVGDVAFGRGDLPSVSAFEPNELRTLAAMLRGGLNSPLTSSAGRLFDAVAALLGLRLKTSFEGQAAMELEFALEGVVTEECYPFELKSEPQPQDEPLLVLDWGQMVEGILADLKRKDPAGLIPQVYNTLARAVVTVARRERMVLPMLRDSTISGYRSLTAAYIYRLI